VPPYPKCSENGDGIECDPEMLGRIQNEEISSSEEDNEENIDPRWEALKNIKNN
jgi:uncharacterized metal-binding protein YceD (DUF177 family)